MNLEAFMERLKKEVIHKLSEIDVSKLTLRQYTYSNEEELTEEERSRIAIIVEEAKMVANNDVEK